MNIIILDLTGNQIISIKLVCHSRRTPKQSKTTKHPPLRNACSAKKDQAIKVWMVFFLQILPSSQNFIGWPLANWELPSIFFRFLPLEAAKRQVAEVHLNKSASLADQAQLSCRPSRGYLEDGLPLCKWLVIRGYINYKPCIARLTLPRGLTNYGYWPLTKWDDPLSA